MTPVLLRPAAADSDAAAATRESDEYLWSDQRVAGTEPSPRAFHTATEVAPSVLVVYGGLGNRCCHTDVSVLDLHRMHWSSPRVGGAPRCVGGRAGHGAFYFARPAVDDGSAAYDGSRAGDLLLVSGASRSTSGDSHQGSIDVLEVACTDDYHLDGTLAGTSVSLEWSHDRSWGNITLPEVRTATYARFARSLVCWSGIGEDHDALDCMHVIDVDRKTVCEAEVHAEAGVSSALGASVPPPRGGAVAAQLSPFAAVVLCGSDPLGEGDPEVDRLSAIPHVLKLALPPTQPPSSL